jgi:S-adenosyl-L-methionine hydrolase (adenosine-forming)
MTPLLTLLTDFGTRDYYVAAVKGTVLRLAPGTQLVDISHEVPPGDIAGGAFLLAAAAPAFPAGTVHLAVVDPGVGSQRRILAVETAAARFLAPDNGLLTPVLAGARVASVERHDLFLQGAAATFHGRDRFAPVAAYLLGGGAVADLGPEIADPVLLDRPQPHREAGLLAGVVAHIDRFGNLVTDIPAGWLPAAVAAAQGRQSTAPPPEPQGAQTFPVPAHRTANNAAIETQVVARVGSHTAVHLAGHYHEIPRHEVALLMGSLGTLELAMRGEDLARRWGVTTGAAVQVRWR